MMYLINRKFGSLIAIFTIYCTVEKTTSKIVSSVNNYEYTSLGNLNVSEIKNGMQNNETVTVGSVNNVNQLNEMKSSNFKNEITDDEMNVSAINTKNRFSNVSSPVLNSSSSLAEASSSSSMGSSVNSSNSLSEINDSSIMSSNLTLQLANDIVISPSSKNDSDASIIENLTVNISNFTEQNDNISHEFIHLIDNISNADNTTNNEILANASSLDTENINSLIQNILNESMDIEDTIEEIYISINSSNIFNNATIDAIAEETKNMKTHVAIDEDAIEFLINQELGPLKCWVNSVHNMTMHEELNVENDTERHIKNFLIILSEDSYGNMDWKTFVMLGRAKKFMHDRYWSGRIIPYNLRGLSKKFWRKQYPLMGLTGLRREFALSRNFNELKYYWFKWREITGKSMKRKFLTYIHANKYNVKNNEEKLFIKEQDNLIVQIDMLYQEILPLYIRLHSYVRKRLLLKYGYRRIHKSGPIPAHLLGDISAHDWTNIEDLLRPYPNKRALKICQNVKERNVSAENIAKMAEDFYMSLGLDKMDKKFWDNSIFETYSRNCTNSFSVKCNNGTLGIHACIDPDCSFFSMFQWASLAQQLKHNATISPVILEALTKVVLLSVSNPGYLYSVGLSDIMIYDKRDEINFLMETALRVIPSMMDSLAVGLWKRKIVDGRIPYWHINKNFWKHRLYYQGLCPPMVRTEKNFDAGAVKSIANDLNVMKEFLSGVLQFQIYKSLCSSSAPEDLHHRCTLHNSREAGKRIRQLLTLEKPVTIMDAISILSNGDEEIKALPMIEYFQPLYDWFLKQDEFDNIGWESYDASVCPKCAF